MLSGLVALDGQTTGPAKTAASGCAPPMPPRPPVRIQLAGEITVIVLAARLGMKVS